MTFLFRRDFSHEVYQSQLLKDFNNVYVCVNIGFNECFDDTERIRAVYSLRNLILKF